MFRRFREFFKRPQDTLVVTFDLKINNRVTFRVEMAADPKDTNILVNDVMKSSPWKSRRSTEILKRQMGTWLGEVFQAEIMDRGLSGSVGKAEITQVDWED